MPFQKQVGVLQAPAVEGDFADSNVRTSVTAGPGGLIAGTFLRAGRFAWITPPLDPDGTPTIANSFGSGPVAGFCHREQTSIMMNYMDTSSMQLPPGMQATLQSSGGYWVKNAGAAAAYPGMKAYADFSNGAVSFAATGAPNATSSTSTASTISAQTASVTGSIADDVMNVTVIGSGLLVPGGLLSGTGVATGTRIVSQIDGTPQGVGNYRVTPNGQTVVATTISETYGLLTVGGTVGGGTYNVGDVITGGGTSANTIITGLGTGTGGLGTYYVNNTQTVGSGALNATGNVETKWVAMSYGAPGELVKMTTHLMG